LLYQTPEIYKTDVATQFKPKKLGWRYACSRPDNEGIGEPAVGLYPHPEIVFNSIVKRVHVHLEDTKTGITYWDADFQLPTNLMWKILGKSILSRTAVPVHPTDVFRKPCVAGDEPEPHLFDLSVQTQDGTYDDNVTPFGEFEGFLNLGGRKAHLGFEAYRLPELEDGGPGKEPVEKLGYWKRGGHYSTGPAHQSRIARMLAGEEDPFYDPKTGDTGRGYYHFIIKPSARKRKMYEYLDKYAAPRVFRGASPW